MHAAYIRPGGVAADLPVSFLEEIYTFISKFIDRIDDFDNILSESRI